MKHLFIINPVAGGIKGRFGRVNSKIQAFAECLEEDSEVFITRSRMDACNKIVREAAVCDRLHVYACGGDGTLNECANGAAGRGNVAVTHYPSGTGNDFIRTFGEDNTVKFRDLHALVNGTVRPLDLIKCNMRYGINICSVGIDARVGKDVHKYSRIPIVGGATGYVVSLIVNVIKGVSHPFQVTIEGETFEKDITLICACNGQYYGGGFNPVPEAMPDDGILEYLILDGVSRLKVAQVVGKYAKGKFREIGDIVRYVRGGSIEIASEHEFAVNIDGESTHANKISFNVVPKGVNFIFPVGI